MSNTTPESPKRSHSLPTKTDKSSGSGAQRKIAGQCWTCDKARPCGSGVYGSQFRRLSEDTEWWELSITTYLAIICLFVWAMVGWIALPFFSFFKLVCYAHVFPCTCTNQVQTSNEGGGTPTLSVIGTIAQSSNATETTHRDDPRQYLLPHSDEEGIPCVSEIRVKDQGSQPQLVQV